MGANLHKHAGRPCLKVACWAAIAIAAAAGVYASTLEPQVVVPRGHVIGIAPNGHEARLNLSTGVLTMTDVSPLPPRPRPEVRKGLLLVSATFDGPFGLEYRTDELTVATGAHRTRILFRRPITFDLSPDKTRLFVRQDNMYMLYAYPSCRLVRGYTHDHLPGRAGRGAFCFAGDDHVVLALEDTPDHPLGTFVLDLNTGRAARVSDVMLEDLRYRLSRPEATTHVVEP